MSCPSKIGPHSGEPCPPFYRPRGEQGLQMRERGKYHEYRGSFEGFGSSFLPTLACTTWQIVSEVAYLLIFVGHALTSFSKWVRPIPPLRAACWTGLLISDPLGSGRRGDCLFVIVESVDSVRNLCLERSGCRMSTSGSSPEG